MNELREMQEDVAKANREKGRGGSPPERVDDEGYSAPAQAPVREENPALSGYDFAKGKGEIAENLRLQANAYIKKPVALIDLVLGKLTGSIGAFPLTDEDIVEFTILGAKVMRRAVDRIREEAECSVPVGTTKKMVQGGNVRGRPRKDIKDVKNAEKEIGDTRVRDRVKKQSKSTTTNTTGLSKGQRGT